MKSLFKNKAYSAIFARDRMKVLLISERLECSPQILSMMQKDLIKTIRKYVIIDEGNVTLQISQNPSVIYVTFPVHKKRDE